VLLRALQGRIIEVKQTSLGSLAAGGHAQTQSKPSLEDMFIYLMKAKNNFQ
jgi:hypothetical protein